MERKIALVESQTDCWFVALEPAIYYRLYKDVVLKLDDSDYGELLKFLGTLPRRKKVSEDDLRRYGFVRTNS